MDLLQVGLKEAFLNQGFWPTCGWERDITGAATRYAALSLQYDNTDVDNITTMKLTIVVEPNGKV